MKGPDFRKSQVVLAGILALTAGAAFAARSQGIGIDKKGIVQTATCEDSAIRNCLRETRLVRWHLLQEPPDADILRVNDFFSQLLKGRPDGYQIDLITPFVAAPTSRRIGILNVVRGNKQDMVLDFRKKLGDIKQFRIKVNSQGIEELSGQEPLDQIYPFLASLFYKNGSPKHYKTVDPESPYRLYLEGIRSLQEYDLNGKRNP